MKTFKKWMGQIPLEEEFSGVGAIKSVYFRLLHAIARYLPMFPRWRVALHKSRGVTIGERVFIGSAVFIDNTYPDSIVIENDVTIISGSYIIGHMFVPMHLQNVMKGEIGGRKGVYLKKGCYIGARSLVLAGVTVGECAIVGSGSVVTHDVPPYSVVAGARQG